MTAQPDDPKEAQSPPPPQDRKLRRLKVSELVGGEKEAILERAGHDYRLRITASGKLILTK